MKLALIVAVADNGVIGRDNQLPWHLPGDLQYFKRMTLGKPVIMGRKTFDSIGKPLPGRTNIVVTRQADWRAEGVVVAGCLASAIDVASDVASNVEGQLSPPEVMLIGGAQLYAESLPHADRLYLTQVHANIEGDAFFPDIDSSQWRQVARQRQGPDNKIALLIPLLF